MEECDADYMDLVDAGVNPLLLYRLNATAVKINKNVDAFKKKLYVDKQIVRRIIILKETNEPPGISKR